MLPETGRPEARALPGQAESSGDLWQTLAPGIAYREFYLPDPNHLYVARLELSEQTASIESSIAQGRLNGGLETVRQMAERYQGAIGYWNEEWGSRNRVVVAINGSYYNPDTGVPLGGQVHSGWYAKRFEDRQTSASFAWTLERQPFIGGCIGHRPARQVITFLPGGQTLPFSGINVPRLEDQLVLYTPQYGATTQQIAGASPQEQPVYEVWVQVEQPVGIAPLPQTVRGVIKGVFEGQSSFPLLFDHVVLSASGSATDDLKQLASVGQGIGISQELRHLDPDCKENWPNAWENTYASVAGSFDFLREGRIQPFDDLGALLWNPRTAVAYNERYVFFIVVDGRERYSSRGVSMSELGVFARNELGAIWGVALDGGGSSTMVVNGRVVNTPTTEVEDETQQPASIERAVANGLMMIIVEAKEQSQEFKPGEQIATTGGEPVEMRLGPGKNYLVWDFVAPATTGIVLENPAGLDGVFASGTYWWLVEIGGLTGWVDQAKLSRLP